MNISGIINNPDLTTKLNSKVSNNDSSVLSDNVSSTADQSFLITNYYDKNQSDSLLQGKANSNNVYSISQIDSALSQKANAIDLSNKANASHVYTKTEVDSAFQTKADMSNYLTDASVFQLSGNYLTDASVFQCSGNYLTNASLCQLSGNYLTTFSPLSGTYVSIINANDT